MKAAAELQVLTLDPKFDRFRLYYLINGNGSGKLFCIYPPNPLTIVFLHVPWRTSQAQKVKESFSPTHGIYFPNPSTYRFEFDHNVPDPALHLIFENIFRMFLIDRHCSNSSDQFKNEVDGLNQFKWIAFREPIALSRKVLLEKTSCLS